MAASIPLGWRWKRWFWTRWQLLRFRLSTPQNIGVPERHRGRLEVAPMGEVYPDIPLRHVRLVSALPDAENSFGMRLLVNTGLFLTKIVRPMRDGLPEVDADEERALEQAGIDAYAAALRRPVRPEVYATPGRPDLGGAAVASPLALFLERADSGELQWDFRHFSRYEHHDGLCSLALRVVFAPVAGTAELAAERIDSDAFGTVGPDDERWVEATRLAICSATTQLALTRHFNYVHLVSGDHWDVATRNRLPSDHPLYRRRKQCFDSDLID